MSKLVFNLKGRNAGDIVMASPYILAAEKQGFDVQVYIDPRVAAPLREVLPVKISPRRPFGYCNIVPVGPSVHMTERWKDALWRRGLELEPQKLEQVDLSANDYVLLNPWCYLNSKRFGTEYWIAAAREASSLGFKVRVAGPLSYRDEAAAICKAVPEIDNHVGKDAGRWVDTVKNARLVVTPDSGAGHVADALGIPTVVLFKSTDPELWSPYWDRSGVLDNPTEGQVRERIKEKLSGTD